MCLCGMCMYLHMYVCLHIQEVIAFQADNSPEVRKFVVTFMEEAW